MSYDQLKIIWTHGKQKKWKNKHVELDTQHCDCWWPGTVGVTLCNKFWDMSEICSRNVHYGVFPLKPPGIFNLSISVSHYLYIHCPDIWLKANAMCAAGIRLLILHVLLWPRGIPQGCGLPLTHPIRHSKALTLPIASTTHTQEVGWNHKKTQEVCIIRCYKKTSVSCENEITRNLQDEGGIPTYAARHVWSF